MSEYTENYRLIKPGTSDFFKISDFNSNSDIIDTVISAESADRKAEIAALPGRIVRGMFPEYTNHHISITIDENSTLYSGDDAYYDVESAYFDPEHDGILMKLNDILIDRIFMTFTEDGNYIRIEVSGASFGIGDVVTIDIYKKPTVITILERTQAQYDAIETPDANTLYIITG